jgi:hypothetical protein
MKIIPLSLDMSHCHSAKKMLKEEKQRRVPILLRRESEVLSDQKKEILL